MTKWTKAEYNQFLKKKSTKAEIPKHPESPTRFWLAGCPRVLKNHKRISCAKGKPIVRPSEACEAYMRALKPQIAQLCPKWKKAIKTVLGPYTSCSRL